MWQKIITNVACIILVCSIALGGLMVVSPTVRAVVLNWLRDISGNRITYFSNGDKLDRRQGLLASHMAPRGMGGNRYIFQKQPIVVEL